MEAGRRIYDCEMRIGETMETDWRMGRDDETVEAAKNEMRIRVTMDGNDSVAGAVSETGS